MRCFVVLQKRVSILKKGVYLIHAINRCAAGTGVAAATVLLGDAKELKRERRERKLQELRYGRPKGDR